jgi:Asp-tRNA(Asn)/Glu-tRNA(Gln) amidotransferase A subunit family amidase
MASADINEIGLADLSARLAAREISSAEAVNAALARLDRLAG